MREMSRPLLRVGWGALAAITMIAMAMRFYRTDDAPVGFYRDEAAISGHAICLSESGRALDGARWPLATLVLGGGHSSIVWLAPAAAWGRLFGTSIGSERCLAALCGALTIVGVFAFGWFATGNRRVGAYAALATAVSPWAFQFSRVAWDPAATPVYLSFALALLFASISPRATVSRWYRWTATVVSGLLFAAACISYPPLRVQVPLVLLAFLVWKRRYARAHLMEAAVFVAVFALASARLWVLTLSGSIQGRYDELSVFNAGYWADEGVRSALGIRLHGLRLFATNLVAHFSPSFLWLSGDANPRHSTQSFGEWSWLDCLALATGGLLAAVKRTRPTGWVSFIVFGYVAGVIPAALTWEGSPHALRSIGSLPFLMVLVGSAIDAAGRRSPRVGPFFPVASTAVASVFALALWGVFFGNYAEGAGDAFDVKVVDQLRDPSVMEQVVAADREGRLNTSGDSYPLLALRYYELRTGQVRCQPRGDLLVFR